MNLCRFMILLLMNSIFVLNAGLKCDDETKDQCKKCNIGEDSDSCATCEDKYFNFFSDLFCYPCNHPRYGQEACEGKCNSTKFTSLRYALCEEDGCKEGFYNYNGRCYNCSLELPGCTKCTYEKKENSLYRELKCLECENEDYNLTEYGSYQLCYSYGC